MFQKALTYAHDSLLKDAAYELELADAASVFLDPASHRQMMTALRFGFRRATRRYRDDAYRASNLFFDIDKKVTTATRDAELGDTLTVLYGCISGDVRVTLRSRYDTQVF